MSEREPTRLELGDGESLACHVTPGRPPTIVFLGGFCSDMTGTKATALEAFARGRGQGFVRFDYRGHGASSGEFAEGTIGRWRDDALAVIDGVTVGRLVLVGSSMGAWIMLLATLGRPERVAGLVGIAAAPDFTEELIWRRYPGELQEKLRAEGVLVAPAEPGLEPVPITLRLIEEAREHLLLEGSIPIRCPTRLLHGLADTSVPWETSLRLAHALESDDVELRLVKAGDHRLSEASDLVRLEEVVSELCDA